MNIISDIEHALSCPKGGLVLERNGNAAKEWGALGARALVPSGITYEQRTGAGARQEGG